MPHKQEEWPILSPEKVTAVGTSQSMLHNDQLPISHCGGSITSTQKERYPSFGRNSITLTMRDRKSSPLGPSSHTVRRKPALSTTSYEESVTGIPSANSSKLAKEKGTKDKVRIEEPHVITSQFTSFPAGSELSASAGRITKPAYELTYIGRPRQTRTSSLRARLSAGQVTLGNPGTKLKVSGFTESTTVDAVPGDIAKNSFQDLEINRNQAQGQSIPILNPKSSSEGPLRANRAPAQSFGSSRRSTPHCPSSRSSVRNESRDTSSISAIEPSARPAPSPPIARELPEPARIVKVEVIKSAKPRQSSIPIFHHTGSNMITQVENETIKNNNMEGDDLIENNIPRDDFEIFEDRGVDSWSEKSNERSINELIEGQHEGVPTNINQPSPALGLQIIEESPTQGYHIKRLSVVSPEFGPTLRISTSADRLILGVEPDMDIQSSITEKLNGESRGFVLPSLREKENGAESTVDPRKRPVRPFSSQGFPQSESHGGFINREWRNKKIKSVELTYSLPSDHLHQNSAKTKGLTMRKSTDTSLVDDPFFDAQSTNDQERATISTAPDKIPTDNEAKHIVDEESWISPMLSNHRVLESTCLNTSISLPMMLQNQDDKESTTDRKDSTAVTPTTATSVVEVVNEVQPTSDFQKRESNASANLPSTPERSSSTTCASTTASFPPRKSSMTIPRDYTIKASSKSSPISPLEVEKCHTQFLERQNQLGASRGLASCPLDITQAGLSKRDSTALEPGKSQGSISKGMLSNIRGLFHKRSAESDVYSSIRLNKKGKQNTSIMYGGSPFPPISEIHPIHRPTLASSNRANTKGRKPIGFDTMAITPVTPSISSPLPSEISTTTTLAMQLLESARTERSSPKKERALELGTVLVEAITQARDAEKAMEEAKQAARKAEVAYVLCKKSVGDIARKVLEWKDDLRE